MWLEGATSTAGRPGSKRGRSGSALSTSASSSFPLFVSLPAPTGGGLDASADGYNDDAMGTTEEKSQQDGPAVGFFAVCRALLEATLRCALGGKGEGAGGDAAGAASYPAEVFADAGAARECWRWVCLA